MSSVARRMALAAGDEGAFVAFVLIGLTSHDEGVTLGSVLRVLGPILVAVVRRGTTGGHLSPARHPDPRARLADRCPRRHPGAVRPLPPARHSSEALRLHGR